MLRLETNKEMPTPDCHSCSVEWGWTEAIAAKAVGASQSPHYYLLRLTWMACARGRQCHPLIHLAHATVGKFGRFCRDVLMKCQYRYRERKRLTE